MTSVAAYDYRGNTVAFVGSRNGKLKKVGLLVCVCVVFLKFLFYFFLSMLVFLFHLNWMEYEVEGKLCVSQDFCRLFIIQLKGSNFLANIFLLVNGYQRFAQ